MSQYRDEQEAQRMRMVSLEERLAELEAENEELRLRDLEAENETLRQHDIEAEPSTLPPLPRRSPISKEPPRLSQDVVETLAGIQAMGIAASEEQEELAEIAAQAKARASAVVPRPSVKREDPAPVDHEPSPNTLSPLSFEAPPKRFPVGNFDDAYWQGFVTGVVVLMAVGLMLYILVGVASP